MRPGPRPAHLVVIASGAVMFFFSFLDFYKVGLGVGLETESVNAWSKGVFPLATFIPILGVTAAILAAVRAFGSGRPLRPVLTMDAKQLTFVLAFAAAVIVIGYLILDGPDKGIGYWFLFLGTIGLTVGAIMDLVDASARPMVGGGAPMYPPGGVPGTPPAYPPQGYGPPGYPPPGSPPPAPGPGGYPPGFGPGPGQQ